MFYLDVLLILISCFLYKVEGQTEYKSISFGTELTCKENNVRVAVQCRYRNTEGKLDTCVDSLVTDNEVKEFASINREECENRGVVPAEFRFRMCNDNKFRFRPDLGHNRIRYKGKIRYPRGWNRPLPPKRCRSHIFQDSIDFCKERFRLKIAMQGNFNRPGKTFSRCYLPWNATIAYTDAP